MIEDNRAKKYNKNDEYYTPKKVFDETIYYADYDPATTKEKALEFGIKNFDTIETDGLKSDWTKYSRIWVNPPFTLKKEFLKKALETIARDVSITIFMVMPIESLTTNWFYDLIKEYDINGMFDLNIPRGRIKFENPNDPSAKSPAFGSVVVELGSGTDRHVSMFEI